MRKLTSYAGLQFLLLAVKPGLRVTDMFAMLNFRLGDVATTAGRLQTFGTVPGVMLKVSVAYHTYHSWDFGAYLRKVSTLERALNVEATRLQVSVLKSYPRA